MDAEFRAHRPVWFRAWGWVHRPVTVMGWVVLLMAVAFCTQVFVAVDRHSHSVSDTLYGIFPYIVPCLIVLEWIASKTSAARESSRAIEKGA